MISFEIGTYLQTCTRYPNDINLCALSNDTEYSDQGYVTIDNHQRQIFQLQKQEQHCFEIKLLNNSSL